MQVLLSFIAKSPNRLTPAFKRLLNEQILETLKETSPTNDFESCHYLSWSSENGGTYAGYVSNEPDPQADYSDKHFSVLIGYSNLEISNFINQREHINLSQMFEASGCFSPFLITKEKISFCTDSLGSHLPWITECRSGWILSNRAYSAHHLAHALDFPEKNFTPRVNLNTIANYAHQGHYMFDDAPFEGLTTCPALSYVTITPTGTNTLNWYIIRGDKQSDLPYDEAVNLLAKCIVDSLAPVAGQESLHFPISGGRDARLLVAALSHYKDLNITSATIGTDDHPDVICARLIAQELGWPHEVKGYTSTPETVSYEHPRERIIRALDVHDFQTSAWDDIIGYGPYIPRPHLSCAGGELLRGGYYAHFSGSVSLAQAQGTIRNVLKPSPYLLTPLSASSQANLDLYLDYAQDDLPAALAQFFRSNQNMRWMLARRRGMRFTANGLDPLLDNRLGLVLLRVPPKPCGEERLSFDIARTLNPAICDLPYEGRRWRFEADGPVPGAEENWDKRIGIPHQPSPPTSNPRLFSHPKTRQVMWSFMDELLEHPRVQPVINIDLIRSQILKDETPKYPTSVWHLATALYFLSGEWVGAPRTQVHRSLEYRP